MPKTDLEKLVVSLEANLKQYEKELARAQKVTVTQLRKIELDSKKSMAGVESTFAKFGASLKAGFMGAIGAITIDRLASAVRGTIKSLADIGDAADRLGLTTDEFQQMGFAAQLAGVEADTFAQGMKKLALNSSEASRGQGELGAILKANKVSITDQNGQILSQVEIMRRVADLIKNARNEQDQAAIAAAAFGKSGTEMLGLLAEGGDAVAAAMQQAAEAGVAFSEAQIRKAQEFDDALDALEKKISVSLKGAIIDAAAGGELALIGLTSTVDQLGIHLDNVGKSARDALNWVLRINPISGPTALAYDYFKGKGEQVTNPKGLPATPGNPDGKTSLPPGVKGDGSHYTPTIIPIPKVRTPKVRQKGPNEYQRSVAQIQENIQLMQAERDAVVANMTAVEGYDAAVEKARVAEGLLNDAKAAGIKITPELTANVNKLAESYVATQQALEQARQQHERFVEALNEAKDLAKDVLGGFVQDLRDGKSALDALTGALGKIESKLIDIAINNLVDKAFGGLMGSGGGGLFGSLISGIFGGGAGAAATLYHTGGIAGRGGQKRSVSPLMFAGAPRYHRGGMAGLRPGELPAILQRGEIILPKNLRPRGGGGGQTVTIIDQRRNAPQVERRQDGQGNLQILIRDQVNSMLASGQMDKGMARFMGGQPARRRP